MKTKAGIAVVMLAVVAVCAGCVRPPRHTTDGEVTRTYVGYGRPKVVILGDSITVMTWNATYNALTNDHAVKIAAWNGEGYDGGPFSDQVGGGTNLLPNAAAAYAPTHPQVVVLAIGTNDAWNPTRDIGRALTAMTKMVNEFQPACMVGVTIPEVSTAPHWNSDRARMLNAAMRGWADQVVDWATISTKPGIMSPSDSIHPTVLGQARRVSEIAAAVRAC